MTLGTFQKNGIETLQPIHGYSESQALISYLLESMLALSPQELSLRRTDVLNTQQLVALEDALERLRKQEPVQYITGVSYFWDRKLYVSPAVLIPRQETEELVDWVLKENKQLGLSVLDIGTGSGCIALTLALEMDRAKVVAVDVQPGIIALAKKNALLYQADVDFSHMDILGAGKEAFSDLDIIVSNPPYIAESEKEAMSSMVLDHEPERALFVPNEDPLLFYKKIAAFGLHWLQKQGKLYVEINESYGPAVVALLSEWGWSDIELRKDLNGKDRMVRAIRPDEHIH